MIISHKYKFIFLKTNKTAGTSIEIALSRFCKPDDIITPISVDDEKIRRELGYAGPQNFYSPICDYRLRDIGRLFLKGKRKKRYYNHITANEVKKNISNEIWENYFKFCFERNPWDRVISLYYARCRAEARPSIAEFIEQQNTFSILKRGGYDVYMIDDKVAVDRVCLFENMYEELDFICQHLCFPVKMILPKAKSNFRKDKRCYKQILTNNEYDQIKSFFGKEIEMFGYSNLLGS